MKKFETSFYKSFEEMFVGIDDNSKENQSGFVNLMHLKRKHITETLSKFKSLVNNDDVIVGQFKEDFFRHLYSFFKNYFTESGSVYFQKTKYSDSIYDKIYNPDEDVSIFWKTHMLYYVKTDNIYKSMKGVKIKDEKSGETYKFDFNCIDESQNNTKTTPFFIYNEKESLKKHLVFDVSLKCEEKQSSFKDLEVPLDVCNQAFAHYKKQAEIDYFINKDTDRFLNNQLDIFLNQALLDDKNRFNQKRLNQYKKIHEYSKRIIAFISQFENELVQVWKKPKFVKNSHYVITLDRFFMTNHVEGEFDFSSKKGSHIITKIINSSGFSDQKKEWERMSSFERISYPKSGGKKKTLEEFESFKIASNLTKDNIFINGKFNETYRYLPIDTKYFTNIYYDIVSYFDDLDRQLDGILIHSDNWQALNTIKYKYREQIQTIYTDPPFNIGEKSDYRYKVNYANSTWLTMLHNRIEILKDMLNSKGNIFMNCDDNGNMYLRMLLDSIFGKDRFSNEIITSYSKPKQAKNSKTLGNNHNTIFHYKNKENSIFNKLHVPSSSDPDKFIFSNDWWTDVTPSTSTVQNDRQLVKRMVEGQTFSTQQLERLYYRIFQISNDLNKRNVVMDIYGGSGPMATVAQKSGNKWIVVEMGSQLKDVILPRMKLTLSGYQFGLNIKDNKSGYLKKLDNFTNSKLAEDFNFSNNLKHTMNYEGGGFFKYYELEQYEDSLRSMIYSEETNLLSDTDIFSNYMFFNDKKLSDVLDLMKGDKVIINFDKLYKNIDLPETISNLLGWKIKRINKKEFVLFDGKKDKKFSLDFENMTNDDKLNFIRMIKHLIFWSN